MVVGERRIGRSHHPSSGRSPVVGEVGRRRRYQVVVAVSWGCLGGRGPGIGAVEGPMDRSRMRHPDCCRSQQDEALAGAAGQAWLAGTEAVVG